ncbi:MAG: polysaccharide pyruvyl transferase family protein [Candidatus Odinarchaeia archaeon]
MKISLITIRSLYNYGAVLQCFAIFKYLKELNFDVQVINYYPQKLKEDRIFLRRIIIRLLTVGKRSKINEFNKANLNYTEACYKNFRELKEKPPMSDIYIVGSDQVWNSKLSKGNLDPAFFLDFIKNKKKISYASSIGRGDINTNELKVMKEHLKDFSHISVREERAKQLLESVGVKDVKVVLDPVFLLKKRDYKKFIRPVKYKKYLLIYSFEKNYTIEKIAQEIAKKMGLQIIEIGTFKSKYSNDKYLQNIGVEDFLSLVNYADFIVTSSFHGTAFSILLNKQFILVEPSIGEIRLKNIANNFGINGRLIAKNNSYKLDDLLKPINYKEVNKLVNINSEKSRTFLRNAVSF